MLRNRKAQERLAREDPRHPGRAFGDHVDVSATSTATAAVPQDIVAVRTQVTDAVARALPQLCDTLKGHIDQRFEDLANRFGAERAIIARPSPGTGGGGVDSRPLPLTKYLDEREEEARFPRSACSF